MEFRGLVQTDKVYTVSELSGIVKVALESAVPSIWVEGEVSNYKKHSSGHIYFTLKDEKSAIRAVLFRGEARNLKFELADGQKIVCRGRISVYEVRGDYQLYVERAEPKGKGALQMAFEQLREKLKAEGLFAEERKKKLPLRPKKVGIVTSPTGAAIKDIRGLQPRYAPLQILITPPGSRGRRAAEIAAGIECLGRRPDIDVIIVGRGGGSVEDLWAFNEERVARAIFACPKPIVSAVGHEVDFTIADFVADLRAPTPSAAAEMVVAREEDFRERIDAQSRRMSELVKYSIGEKKAMVQDLAGNRIFYNFRIRLMNFGQRVDDLENRARQTMDSRRRRLMETRAAAEMAEERLTSLMKAGLKDRLSSWDKLAAALNSLSPLNVLKKGYTLCWTNGGFAIAHTIKEINEGETVVVSFYRGEFEAEVKRVDRAKLLESRFLKEQE